MQENEIRLVDEPEELCSTFEGERAVSVRFVRIESFCSRWTNRRRPEILSNSICRSISI